MRIDLVNPRVRKSLDREGMGRLKAFGDVLQRVIKGLKPRHGQFGRIMRVWTEIAPDLAERSRIVLYYQGRLVIEVDSAPLVHELQAYRRHELLASFQQHPRAQDVVELKFQLPRRPEDA